jgi:iron complex transport system permease protein
MTWRRTLVAGVLLSLPLFIGLFSLTQGAYHIPLTHVVELLLSKLIHVEGTWNATEEVVLFQVRLPRIILVALVGASLSVSGAVLQAIFKNPLVSPYLLGISSGASLGASVVIVFFASYNPFLIQTSAFSFVILAVFLAYLIAKIHGPWNNTILVLAGVIVTTFFSAIVTLLQYLSAVDKLQAIVFWMMGSFSAAQWAHVAQVAPFSLSGCLLLVLLSWRINVLSLGEQEARSLGVNPEYLRVILILVTSLMTTTAVAVAGPIGWVGLVIPHVVRMIVGANNYLVLIGAIGLGAAFLLVVDLAARSLLNIELPVGIVTAMVGGPFFVFIMTRAKQSIW